MDNPQHVRDRLGGVNIPGIERVGTIALGSTLAAFGLWRRSLAGWAITAAGVALAARGLGGRCPMYRRQAMRHGVEVQRSVTIQRPPREVYRLWRNLTNLPRFMKHVSSVETQDDRVSHWVVEMGPVRLEWLAEIIEDVPDRLLRWESLPGGHITHEGSIEISEAPGDRGTLVQVTMRYQPPAEAVTGLFKGFLRTVTTQQLASDLIRLRQLLETGEIATGARRPQELDGDDKALSAPRAVASPAATPVAVSPPVTAPVEPSNVFAPPPPARGEA